MEFRHDPMSVVEGALKERNWRYMRSSAGGILTGVGEDGRSVTIAIMNDEERKTLLFQMHPTVGREASLLSGIMSGRPPFMRVHVTAGITAAQVAHVCEMLLDRNSQMLLGSFDRNASSGELRLRIALPYRDGPVTMEQVSWCVDIGAQSTYMVMLEIEKITGRGSVQLEEV
jgi:hypothetical protein